MLRLVTNNERPRDYAASGLSEGDHAEMMDAARQLMRALGISEEDLAAPSLAGPQIIWSRSARRWRRAGWRPQNHRSSPYSVQ